MRDKGINNNVIVGIDATNIRKGGGVTHLLELLVATHPEQSSIKKIVVWGGNETMSQLPERPWLDTISPWMLNKGLMFRTIWQVFSLSRSVRMNQCDVLFVPGGSYIGSFTPVVTMSQNLLPFDSLEIRRFGLSKTSIRLLLLRFTQSWAFKRSAGVIFLTKYARQTVEKNTKKLGNTIIKLINILRITRLK